MFGSLRFLLALLVVITHLGGIEIAGGVAVWGFFMLSGFLMTAVLNQKYGFSGAGLASFAKSRITRLYPTYLASLLLTLAVFWAGRGIVDPTLLNSSWAVPDTPRDIFANLFIVGHTTLGLGRIESALSPSAWAIDVEILMYACSALFLSRSVKIARITFWILLVAFPLLWMAAKFTARQGEIELSNSLIYSFLPAALLPYSVGAWMWFIRTRLPVWLANPLAGAISTLAIVTCVLVISKFSVTASFVMTLPFLAALIAGLAQIRISGRIERVDSFLGLMSYPIYLLHWLGAYALAVLAPASLGLTYVDGRFMHVTPGGFAAAVFVVLVASALVAQFIEAPVERIRHHFARPLQKVGHTA